MDNDAVWLLSIKVKRKCYFAVSQVEYGVRNLVATKDPRLTVVMDCQGTKTFGFPVQMLKSCIVLVQEHYPMRLASFFVINAPPLVRAVANAIIQVKSPPFFTRHLLVFISVNISRAGVSL